MQRCQLYIVTPPKIDLVPFAETFKATLDAGDVSVVQLRLKDADDDTILRAAETLLPIAQERGVAFLLNDRPDLAGQLDCDGVHVGQNDASYADARQRVGNNNIVGMTCHDSRHLAIMAADSGADYVAFGAFFPTETKYPKAHTEPEILEWWSDIMTVPCVAIGGITVENAPVLVEAGADFLAVVAGIWQYADGPAKAVKAFNALFDQHAAT